MTETNKKSIEATIFFMIIVSFFALASWTITKIGDHLHEQYLQSAEYKLFVSCKEKYGHSAIGDIPLDCYNSFKANYYIQR